MNNIFSISIVWFIAITCSVAIVKFTSIGKVIFVISESHGMGVHSFDLIILIPLTMAVLFTAHTMKSF